MSEGVFDDLEVRIREISDQLDEMMNRKKNTDPESWDIVQKEIKRQKRTRP